MSRSLCPCCSKKSFAQCCGPYLNGAATPRTVQQLMRSRYSAFALGGYGSYLLETWHPDTRPAVAAETLSAEVQAWQGLQILHHSQNGNEGSVEFLAQYRSHEGDSGAHHEVSRFIRVAGKWLYLDGKEEQ